MKTLTVFEHSYIAVSEDASDLQLLPKEVDALHRAQKSMGAKAFTWAGRRRIKAAQFVGVIATPSVRLEILPKIEKIEHIETRGTLIKMIGAAQSIPIYDGDITPIRKTKIF